MQVAQIMLALGGEMGQTIPKFMVTPSEVAVLRVIHGQDAVFDVTVVGDVDRSHRTERERLVRDYGRGMNGEIRCPAVDQLFPGVAARLFDRFDELADPTGAEFEPENETFVPIVPQPVEKLASKRGRGAKRDKVELATPEDVTGDQGDAKNFD